MNSSSSMGTSMQVGHTMHHTSVSVIKLCSQLVSGCHVYVRVSEWVNITGKLEGEAGSKW